ncbi:MAG: hypothetical protein H6834_11255 [Planctomycetes bacterium]|nr:hypothetical protein [Planctomycetota bacterium]
MKRSLCFPLVTWFTTIGLCEAQSPPDLALESKAHYWNGTDSGSFGTTLPFILSDGDHLELRVSNVQPGERVFITGYVWVDGIPDDPNSTALADSLVAAFPWLGEVFPWNFGSVYGLDSRFSIQQNNALTVPHPELWWYMGELANELENGAGSERTIVVSAIDPILQPAWFANLGTSPLGAIADDRYAWKKSSIWSLPQTGNPGTWLDPAFLGGAFLQVQLQQAHQAEPGTPAFDDFIALFTDFVANNVSYVVSLQAIAVTKDPDPQGTPNHISRIAPPITFRHSGIRFASQGGPPCSSDPEIPAFGTVMPSCLVPAYVAGEVKHAYITVGSHGKETYFEFDFGNLDLEMVMAGLPEVEVIYATPDSELCWDVSPEWRLEWAAPDCATKRIRLRADVPECAISGPVVIWIPSAQTLFQPFALGSDVFGLAQLHVTPG